MPKKGKTARDKRKKNLAKHFPIINEGDSVALVRDLSSKPCFPKRFHGLTGKVLIKQGKAYIVEFFDQDKKKTLAINPVHLKKIQNKLEIKKLKK